MSAALAVADTRLVADLNLELSFVLTAKTLLSEQHSSDELPLRFNVVFDDYMKLAGLVLGLPPLDFANCSLTLRSFAKRMEKSGFISMASGLLVTKIHHRTVDDIYPDATIFAGGAVADEQEEDILDGLLDPSDLDAIDSEDEVATGLLQGLSADGPANADVGNLTVADSEDEGSVARLARQNKRKLTRKMALLRVLHQRQEEKQAWLLQKQEKQTRKMLEKELRKTNIRHDDERRESKYEMLMSQDSQARAFHYRHTKSLKAAEMLLAITQSNERLQKQLRDITGDITVGPQAQRIVGSAAQQEAKTSEPQPQVPAEPQPAGEVAGFAKPNEEDGRAEDDRGAQKHRYKALDSRTPASESGTALGTNLKVVRDVRKLLVALGFDNSRELADLPDYSKLRSAYKRALLAVHPDKAPGSAAEYEQLQANFQDLLARYYDCSAQDFNAEVKAHRKVHKAKAAEDAQGKALREPQAKAAKAGKASKETRGLRAHRAKK